MAETVGETLERLAAARGVSLSELSRLIGRNLAYLQQFVRRGTPRQLAERDRQMLAQFLGVEEALLGGLPREGTIAVPYLTVAASAGRGVAAAQERTIRHEAFAAPMLRDAGISPAEASLIDATGESMLPTIHPGDRLLVDRSDVKLAAAGIYVVRRSDDLLVKRLRREREWLLLLSDNPDYPPVRCAPEDAVVVGRVKLLLRQP
ncbi:S24 family peptidase [Sphingomonas jeddahensis]|uniref:Putative HTH-type transcriptional regulator n=1 Tax=Sphingomonas jeddahensis TaxID=1915074 RepID=A0A1V2ETE9_9SPHN|nr:S24 family peptidase [Sphingomonas jeddahensis]ONF95755.1 putative HTH-type transcriptional regulator [Sphingomonas jeddahensis]